MPISIGIQSKAMGVDQFYAPVLPADPASLLMLIAKDEHWGFKAVPHAYFIALFLMLPTWKWRTTYRPAMKSKLLLSWHAGILLFCWMAPEPLNYLIVPTLFAGSVVLACLLLFGKFIR